MAGSIGLTTKFGYRPFKSASGTTYTTLASVTSITPGSFSFEKPESTTLDSTQKDYVRGLADRESGLTINFNPGDAGFYATKAALVTSSTANYDFVVTWVDGSTTAFSGFVSEWKPSDVAPNEVLTVDITITVLSPDTDTPATTAH